MLALGLTADKTPIMSCSLGAVLEQHGQAGEEGIPVVFAEVNPNMDAPGKTIHPCGCGTILPTSSKSPLLQKQRPLCCLSHPWPPQSHGGQPWAASPPRTEPETRP